MRKKNSILIKFAPDWLTLVSGVLVVVAFPPWNLGFLIWISLIPWLLALHRAKDLQQAIVQGVWFSIIMSVGGFYWVAYALQEFGNLPWAVCILGLILFGIVGQPQFIAFAALYKKLESSGYLKIKSQGPGPASHQPLRRAFRPGLMLWVLILFLAFAYTTLDAFLPKIFQDTLGHATYQDRYMRQVADLGGASLITFLIFFWNYSLLHSLRALKKNHKISSILNPSFVPLLFALLSVGAAWTYGYFRHQEIQTIVKDSTHSLQMAAIQANIGDFDKVAAEGGLGGAATQVMNTFTSMTDLALKLDPRPEVVIWPETAYPSTFRTPHSYLDAKLDERLENYSHSISVPLLFGGYDHFQGKDFNAFFFLSPLGQLQTYRKSILLLFGEYIPGADSFPFIKSAFPQVGNFGRGAGPEILAVDTAKEKVRISPMICYEALFPWFNIEAARKGAQIILNITNDSWFGTWGEPQLHLALSAFRSIETRLPMLRSTNTGISALILPDGEITQATSIGVQTVMNAKVPITPPIPTLMRLWGDWFCYLCLVLSGLGSWLIFRQRLLMKSR